MLYTPNKILQEFKKETIDKSCAANLLISIIENVEDPEIRKKSIDILHHINYTHVKVFEILENLLISDTDDKIRLSAAKVISDKFLHKSLFPMKWALKNEDSYNCLISVTNSLEKIGNDSAKEILLTEIKKIGHTRFQESINTLLNNNKLNSYSANKLGLILKNYFTLLYLNKKFSNLRYTLEKGLISELDFSRVDNQIVGWRSRNQIQNLSELLGVQYLSDLKNLKLFPLNWTLQNEYSYKWQIKLIKKIEKFHNQFAKDLILDYLGKAPTPPLGKKIKKSLDLSSHLEFLSLTSLVKILINYISIFFLKKKFPNLDFRAKDGKIVVLEIKNSSLIKFPDVILNLKELRVLKLIDCKLYSLPHTFSAFKELKSLDLHSNNIEVLPEAISALTRLRELNLSKNSLKNLQYSLKDLKNLTQLNLSHNDIAELPESIGNLKGLQYLNLNNNKLERLPSTIKMFQNLGKLKLSQNKLRMLPDSFGKMNKLKKLDLDNNLLEQIPERIFTPNSLQNLQALDLSDNKLKALPATFQYLSALEELNLSWNRLSSLPAEFGKLYMLRKLILVHNIIQKIPRSFERLQNLEILDLSWNNLKSFPNGIEALESLKKLILYENQISKLTPNIGNFVALEILNLWGNKLKSIPNSLGNLMNLRELWLNGNHLETIPVTLANLDSLTKLVLNNNKITKIPDQIKTISSLEELSLKWNNLNE
ncbi:MAG: leucine-rich repeat domain-containing protein [Promethearchaeia archaeon]